MYTRMVDRLYVGFYKYTFLMYTNLMSNNTYRPIKKSRTVYYLSFCFTLFFYILGLSVNFTWYTMYTLQKVTLVK